VGEGSITGTVQDSSGAVVANARVTLLNTDVGLSLETNTNNSGEYSFSPVRIGHYTVTLTARSFSKTTQQNLQVAVSQNMQVNVQLKPWAATETVEVTDASPVLQTEDASIGQTAGERTVNNLPLNGRNFTFLAQLDAGTQTPQADTRRNASNGAFAANGLRPASASRSASPAFLSFIRVSASFMSSGRLGQPRSKSFLNDAGHQLA
jgi:hypothetical protein